LDKVLYSHLVFYQKKDSQVLGIISDIKLLEVIIYQKSQSPDNNDDNNDNNNNNNNRRPNNNNQPLNQPLDHPSNINQLSGDRENNCAFLCYILFNFSS